MDLNGMLMMPYLVAMDNAAETAAKSPGRNLDEVCAEFGLYDLSAAEKSYLTQRISEVSR